MCSSQQHFHSRFFSSHWGATCLSTGIFFRWEKCSVKSNTGALQHRNDVKALERGGRALAAARGASLLSWVQLRWRRLQRIFQHWRRCWGHSMTQYGDELCFSSTAWKSFRPWSSRSRDANRKIATKARISEVVKMREWWFLSEQALKCVVLCVLFGKIPATSTHPHPPTVTHTPTCTQRGRKEREEAERSLYFVMSVFLSHFHKTCTGEGKVFQ